MQVKLVRFEKELKDKKGQVFKVNEYYFQLENGCLIHFMPFKTTFKDEKGVEKTYSNEREIKVLCDYGNK